MSIYDDSQENLSSEQSFSDPSSLTHADRRSSFFSLQPQSGRGCLQFCIGFIIAVLLLGILLIFTVGMLGKGCAAAFSSIRTISDSATSNFRSSADRFSEKVLIKGNNPENKRIAVISIQGMIQFGGQYTQSAVAENILQELKAAMEDSSISALILDMNTPGGEVVASDEILQQVKKCRRAGKPVVTCMRSLGASGGYFIASGSDWIVANRMTFTGSIGVIISSYQFTELMDKLGIEPEVYRSGKMKDMLSSSRKPTHQEKNYIQSLVMETYHEFCQVVADGRKRYRNAAEVAAAPFGDGRVLSGTAALQAGLIDQIGYFDDAVKKARELGKAPGAEVVAYSQTPSLLDFILSLKAPRSLNLDGLIGRGAFSPDPGKLYFLPAEYLQHTR